jgi:predicted RNase H-like nuclease (RuvC/YqgF family)
MSKKPNKKDAILEYVKNNPKAKNAEVAKACGVHPTYASMIRRNDGVKKPKKSKPAAKPEFVFKQDFAPLLVRQVNELREENEELKDIIIRMDGVIKYLEDKVREALKDTLYEAFEKSNGTSI